MKTSERVSQILLGEDEIRVCKDISEEACREQPGNALRYLGISLGNKLADALADARLVLPWLAGAISAPAFVTGFLVPIREAGALLPQLFLGAWIRRQPRRKHAWAIGNGLQALAALGLGLVALFGSAWLGGILLLAALTLQSTARALSSISSKDVLGKTIAKKRRGRVAGFAGSAASALGLLIGLGLSLFGDGGDRPEQSILAALLFGAAGGWLIATLGALSIHEEKGETSGGEDAWRAVQDGLRMLRNDSAFRGFNIARLLALGSAMALPFVTVLARENGAGSLSDLGLLVVASGLAGVISSPIWGLLSDTAAHRVMAIGALGSGGTTVVAASVHWMPESVSSSRWTYIALYSLLALSHTGIRLGRQTYIVDISDSDNRAMRVAVTNTVTGLAFLLVGAAFSSLASVAGIPLAMFGMALSALLAALVAARLPSA